jgi:primosomal protein N'
VEKYVKPEFEQELAALNGESQDILLPKPANREQLQIAERIQKESAVVVQGPPGTGKTYTIANILGHFLAEGKSVLVTSQKSRALSVLQENYLKK